MAQTAHDPDMPIDFSPQFREYGIRILDGGTSYQAMSFCPWCGKRLPASLRDQWFEELEKLGLDPAEDAIPPEYSDERWYVTVRPL